MNLRTYNKLKKEGFDEEWLDNVKKHWNPKKFGKYEMRITSIEDLSDDPKDGLFIDTTRFDNANELSVIHHFFEGNAYVMTIADTGEQISQGIIDGAPFDECSYYETGEYGSPDWEWTDYTIEEIIKMDLKTLGYYNRVEDAYDEMVIKNRMLREENARLKEKLARLERKDV